jgi:hypothetical protein
MMRIQPTLSWHTSISDARQVAPRCPFAPVHLCPSFYESLSRLGRAGSLPLVPKVERLCRRKWEGFTPWLATQGKVASISGPPSKSTIYSNFCPEVLYSRFGLFAASLIRYSDEIDAGIVHAQLKKDGTPNDNWRWAWAHATHLHYTEYPLFSSLRLQATQRTDAAQPEGMLQIILQAVSHWQPFWKHSTLVALALFLCGFALWVSLPDNIKIDLLSSFRFISDQPSTGAPVRK